MIRKSIATAAMIFAFALAPVGAAYATPDICSTDRTSANYCPVAGDEK